MKKAFTLLELVIVLLIVSLTLTITLPTFFNIEATSMENFENKLKTATNSVFNLSNPIELCADFKENSINVGKEKIPLPRGKKLKYMILPGKIISSESSSKFCISSKGLETVGFLAKESTNKYLSILVFLPSGETEIRFLSEAEGETFKDKVSKGRIVEWFNYY
ncbi:hypothetical protein Dester_1391 [Desulfurobacterium thermolithotrophum DSM 11699]|uniref:Prepilin-type N-terminal cleavage/methylation domain-containing protein n=1 Tax=Desulfurobacterium thermolithotrophum (strain DSM 11699 / BSA) TaxID=868864 RepID=F0S1L9_DESTD|nr:prepilin-type N-terminal cleavage/methylation domain-containing protein [Desulfurobacterium thermolithotrophum]ADY74022.1 hypothetical protein Dester_1391 [Desulfurobacterium thermolithotrophum DSM 11699]